MMIDLFLFATLYEVKLDGTGDFASIQAGIDESVIGDSILVYPGTYFENINYNGKDIVVGSLLLTTGDESYIYNTIIDANHNGRVVTFENNETNTAILIGFTIQNGFLIDTSGGGIYINHSSPSMKFLNITENTAISAGGILISSSNVFLEAVNIYNNHSLGSGGGMQISRRIPNPVNSYPIFSSSNKCSIYNNSAGWFADIAIQENLTTVTTIPLKIFTIDNPDRNYVSQYPNLNLQYEETWLEQVEYDVYVSPEGDDENSGISWAEPLKTIQWALSKIKSDSLNPRDIYLSPGIYSPETNGEKFSLNMRSYINVIGSGVEETILTSNNSLYSSISIFYDTDVSIQSLTLSDIEAKTIINTYHMHDSDYTTTLLSSVHLSSNATSVNVLTNGYGKIVLKNVVFENNKCPKIISLYNNSSIPTDVTLQSVIFHDNEKYPEDDSGGSSLGILRMNEVSINNCLFYENNTDSNDWPPIQINFQNNEKVDFFNNTIANNSSESPYGCLIGVGDQNEGTESEINIANCDIYGNSTPFVFAVTNGDGPTTVNVSNSIIEGGTDPEILNIVAPGEYSPEFIFGENILDEPPLFLGGDWNDPLAYQLTANSPGVDAGTNDIELPDNDLLGNLRIWDGDDDGFALVDIGCYEFGSEPDSTSNSEDVIENLKTDFYNYPNPFNPETRIVYELKQDSQVTLQIYNIKGQRICSILQKKNLQSGTYETIWDGKDDNGIFVSSGVYFYKLKTNHGLEKIRKCLLVK